MFPLLGYDMSDETDELTPLSYYAKGALERKERTKKNIMCVMDEACSSCVQVNYEISNLCRGCVARSCYMNCPKNAINFKPIFKYPTIFPTIRNYHNASLKTSKACHIFT